MQADGRGNSKKTAIRSIHFAEIWTTHARITHVQYPKRLMVPETARPYDEHLTQDKIFHMTDLNTVGYNSIPSVNEVKM